MALKVKLEDPCLSKTCRMPFLRSDLALPVGVASSVTPAASCACFPPQFHAVAVSSRPQLLTILPKLSPSQHVAALTKQLLHCMACYQLLQFKGSMLALAIVSLELEKLLPDWLALIIELLQKAQVRGCWHRALRQGGTRGHRRLHLAQYSSDPSQPGLSAP